MSAWIGRLRGRFGRAVMVSPDNFYREQTSVLRQIALGALALTMTVGSAYAQKLTACPTESEVKASIEKSGRINYKAYRVTSVSGFQFGAMQFGRIYQAELAGILQDTCPVRLTYTYVLGWTDGSRETMQFGNGVTHYFYKDGFSEWVFKN